MASERLHVVPHEQGWALKREGSNKVESTHSTQRDAIDAGRDLARDQEVDLVVHRSDGTFRNVLTYTNEPMSEKSNGNGKKVEPHDVFSVGSRVSWGAVAAGAAIALTMNVALWLGGLALGVTVAEQVTGRTLTIAGAIWMLVTTLLSLFVGGYIVSRLTAGEDRSEAAMYGVVMWGLLFIATMALGNAGLSTGLNLASMRSPSATESWVNTELYSEARLSAEQKETFEKARTAAREAAGDLDPRAAAWWGFTTIILSLAAAMAGSWLGAGPVFTFLRRTGTRPTTTTQAPGAPA